MPRMERAYFVQACLSIIWGLNWPISKMGLTEVPPFTFGLLRVSIGLVVVLAWLMPWQLLTAALPLGLSYVALERGAQVVWSASSICTLLYGGVFATGVAFWMVQRVSMSLQPIAGSVGFLGVPVVGLLASSVILAEPLSIVDVAGVCLTFAGVVVVSIPSLSRRAVAPRDVVGVG